MPLKFVHCFTAPNFWKVIGSCLLSSLLSAQVQASPPDTIAQRTLACAACHGKEGRATSDGYYPRIAGKPAGYLYQQLLNFRDGRRQHQHMTYMVGQLSDAYLREIAEYFSNLHLPYAAPQKVTLSAAQAVRGEQLVKQGDASKKIPACVACHGDRLTGVAPAIPGLLGLPRDYLNGQIGSWQTQTRRAAAPDCMAQIAQRLNIEDLGAISAWLANQPVPALSTPEPALAKSLPIPCGSVPNSQKQVQP